MSRTGPRMGVLVVGVGFLGAQRAAAARVAQGARLVAVTDVRPDLAGAVASRHRSLAVPGLSEGLKLPGVDAVIIATPPSVKRHATPLAAGFQPVAWLRAWSGSLRFIGESTRPPAAR